MLPGFSVSFGLVFEFCSKLFSAGWSGSYLMTTNKQLLEARNTSSCNVVIALKLIILVS